MKVIIAGSRSITSLADVCIAIGESGFISQITEVVSGTAQGVDRLGELWARTHNKPVRQFPADWGMGYHAGFARNRLMAEYADAAIIVWDGRSRGSMHMQKCMLKLGKPVFVHRLTTTKED